MAKPNVLLRPMRLAGAALLAFAALNGCSDYPRQLPSSEGTAGGGPSGAAGSASSGNAGASHGGQGGTPHVGSSSSDAGTANGGVTSAGGTVGGLGGSGTGDNASGETSAGAGRGGSNGGGGGGSAIGGSGGQAPAGNGCIVPLYSYPSAAAWNAIVQAKQAHAAVNVVAIVNPNSGPGTSVDGTFTAGIAKLVAAGIVPIGYVSTNYTKRGQAAVKADTDAWRASYPAVQGIFFDEQSITPGDEAFYSAVADYAKTKGFVLTVGNPGTGVPNSFLDTVDVMLSYESAGTPTLASLQKYAAHRDQFGIIPYATTFDAAYVKAAAKSVRYVYLTDDALPNPWDALPSYFDALLGALTP